MAKAAATFLTPAQVSERWDNAISIGTLANWRNKGTGPNYQKFGTRVRYTVQDLEQWEKDNHRAANDNQKGKK